MFDYDSTGLWYLSDDGREKPAGTVDPHDLPLSSATVDALARWIARCDALNMRTWTASEEPEPTDAEWVAVREEEIRIWRTLRAEAGPDWEVGLRTASGVV